MNPKAYAALLKVTEDEWRAMAQRLTRYSLTASRQLRWRTQNSQELPGGETVGSIVSKAIEKLYTGERNWDPEKQTNLEKYLQSVIDSLLNHLATSDENVIVIAAPESASNDAADWERGSSQRDPAADWLIPPSRSPEAVLAREQRTALEDHALELLLDECSEDPVLFAVVEAMMDGYDTPAEISGAKGLEVKDVYNAAKRLDRKLELVRERIALEQGGSADRKKEL